MLCELLASKPVMSHGNQIAQVNKEDLILQEQKGSYFHWKGPRESFPVGRHSVKSRDILHLFCSISNFKVFGFVNTTSASMLK